jgi:hypothetical protein
MSMINIVRDIQEQRGFPQNYTVGTMLYLITYSTANSTKFIQNKSMAIID